MTSGGVHLRPATSFRQPLQGALRAVLSVMPLAMSWYMGCFRSAVWYTPAYGCVAPPFTSCATEVTRASGPWGAGYRASANRRVHLVSVQFCLASDCVATAVHAMKSCQAQRYCPLRSRLENYSLSRTFITLIVELAHLDVCDVVVPRHDDVAAVRLLHVPRDGVHQRQLSGPVALPVVACAGQGLG